MSECKWAWIEHGVGELVVYDTESEYAVCCFDDGGDLCGWPDGYTTDGTAKRNARLIAAAPELHEALEEAFIELQKRIGTEIKPEPRLQAWYGKAGIALAKAGGESQ